MRVGYSIFCNLIDLDYKVAKKLAVEWLGYFNDIGFRDYLRKSSNTAMLLIVRTNLLRNHPSNKRFRQVYLTIYCNDSIKIDSITRYVMESNININYISRKVNRHQLDSSIATIRRQKLHDLSFLGSKKRYSIINKKLLMPMQEI